ncbi:terminase small subunit [Litoribacter ruber]|uniref:terminase small subunit n=1 Tax=Litoribacter ruber TaxID=702568 RepID=UPI001BDA26C7|nr:terminase small subunit [Litoribacter ruber]MBT0811052.1 terminase small subunit [Litoribacter ruber]
MSNKKAIQIGEETITLTDKEIKFVEAYLSDGTRNATASAIKAGYSENSAGQIGHSTLKKHEIQKYIQFLSAPLLEQAGVTQERLVQELARVGFANVVDIMQGDWQLKPLDELTKNQTAAISAISVQEITHQDEEGRQVTTRKVQVKHHDKLKSLVVLAEMAGLTKKQEEPPSAQNNFFNEINNYYNQA